MPYQPNWSSIQKHATPQWFKDAKFGIYTHWGLGVDQELAWTLTPDGLTIQTPPQKPCDHAYVFKIERGHPYRK